MLCDVDRTKESCVVLAYVASYRSLWFAYNEFDEGIGIENKRTGEATGA